MLRGLTTENPKVNSQYLIMFDLLKTKNFETYTFFKTDDGKITFAVVPFQGRFIVFYHSDSDVKNPSLKFLSARQAQDIKRMLTLQKGVEIRDITIDTAYSIDGEILSSNLSLWGNNDVTSLNEGSPEC